MATADQAAPGGRTPKIEQLVPGTEKTVGDHIVDDLRVGGYIEDAARRAGVNPSTVHRWIARGAEWEDVDEDEVAPEELPFCKFCKAAEKARAEAVMTSLAIIRRAAQGTPAEYDPSGNLVRDESKPTWQAAAWYLERTRPHEFGRQVHEHTGKDGAPLSLTDLEAAVDAEDASK